MTGVSGRILWCLVSLFCCGPCLARLEAASPADPQTPATKPSSKITQGLIGFQFLTNDCVAFIGGTSVVGDAKHAFLESLLTRRYPRHQLRFRNLGWEGDTVLRQERPLNFDGLIQSVKSQKATVVFAQFGLMESLGGREKLAAFVQAYNALLDDLGQVTPRIVLLTPFGFEAHAGLDSEPPERTRNLELYVAAVRELAEQHGLRSVDLSKLRKPGIRPDDSTPLTLNGIHPSAYGSWRIAYEIEKALGLGQNDWTVTIDARAKQHQAAGTMLSDVQIAATAVRFRAFDVMLPGPVLRRSETDLSVWKKRVLKISNLTPGRYVLWIDGKPLYEQSHRFWEEGWALTRGPEFSQSERLRELIVEKNSEFFNYWRPQNWAFLNGDLTSQPSSRRHDNFNVRWFPGEMHGFVPLIEKKEIEISELASPGVHSYELKRVE